jgi:hypothetical protein
MIIPLAEISTTCPASFSSVSAKLDCQEPIMGSTRLLGVELSSFEHANDKSNTKVNANFFHDFIKFLNE